MTTTESRGSAAAVPQVARPVRAEGWNLWIAQLLAILRIEIKKTAFSRRALGIYALCALPLFIFTIIAFIAPPAEFHDNVGSGRPIFSFIYHTLILGTVVFFGCAVIFTNLFRGDVLDRSLHYYLLTPTRRWLLALAKYLSGLAVTLTMFCGVTTICYLLFYIPFGLDRAVQDMTSGPGLSHLFAYLATTSLACLGYGAVFLSLGLLFKSPILPIAGVLAWESIQFLLPAALKKFSITHYLLGLVPVPLPEGPLAILASPPPAWMSVLGLLGLSALGLGVAIWKLRAIEVRYGDD